MKIFGIGLSRTGTTSFHEAAKILGFKSCHNLHGGANNAVDYIMDYMLYGIMPTYIFDNFDAFWDIPIPFMYERLYELYPDAKFILTTRNIDDWLVSVNRWFSNLNKTFSLKKTPYDYPKLEIDVPSLLRFLLYNSIEFNSVVFEALYNKHFDDVTNFFKNKNNLLIIDINEEQKWKPLCDFLEVNVPDVDFPKLNMWPGENNDD